jgi:hypothetical protein
MMDCRHLGFVMNRWTEQDGVSGSTVIMNQPVTMSQFFRMLPVDTIAHLWNIPDWQFRLEEQIFD